MIYTAGAPGDRLYVVRRGAVQLVSRGGLTDVVRAPGWFGEMGALTGEPRTQTATVVEDAALLVVESAAFRTALLQNPFLALEIAKALGPQA